MTDGRTASWAEVEAEAPELMAVVRGCFTVRKHCTMATLRRDGSPITCSTSSPSRYPWPASLSTWG